MAKVEESKPKQVKIGQKTVDCIFIGYAKNNSAYWFLVPESNIQNVHENTIINLRIVYFLKTRRNKT